MSTGVQYSEEIYARYPISFLTTYLQSFFFVTLRLPSTAQSISSGASPGRQTYSGRSQTVHGIILDTTGYPT